MLPVLAEAVMASAVTNSISPLVVFWLAPDRNLIPPPCAAAAPPPLTWTSPPRSVTWSEPLVSPPDTTTVPPVLPLSAVVEVADPALMKTKPPEAP